MCMADLARDDTGRAGEPQPRLYVLLPEGTLSKRLTLRPASIGQAHPCPLPEGLADWRDTMKSTDCPGCHTELSEYACKFHRLGPRLLAALEKAWGRADFSAVDSATIDEIATVLAEADEAT